MPLLSEGRLNNLLSRIKRLETQRSQQDSQVPFIWIDVEPDYVPPKRILRKLQADSLKRGLKIAILPRKKEVESGEWRKYLAHHKPELGI